METNLINDWQKPNITELTAFLSHQNNPDKYLGIPWASLIDSGLIENYYTEIHYKASFLEKVSFQSTHTVCQHVYWHEAASTWHGLGITDVWLSHAAENGVRPGSNKAAVDLPRVHAWPLYAVNVDDSARRKGLALGKDPRSKKYLASFIGAHMPHYLSDSRLRLEFLRKNPNFYIKITGDQWHFDGIVYGHQVEGKPLADVYQIDDSVTEYNRVLSDSVFALCPAGAGRNTIRLWEAMAVGAVPVLLDEPPLFPQRGSLPPIDWDKIVIQLSIEDIPDLPLILRRIPMDEIKARQRLAMEAYAHVREMRCF